MEKTGKARIEKTSLVDNICRYLSNEILTFQIKPGESISEIELLKELGVSRSPIREAIRLLEGEGLLERVANKGVFVKKISAKEVRELFPIRTALKAMAAELAVVNMKPSDLAGMERVCRRMEEAFKKDNIKKFVQRYAEFHWKYIKAAGNKTLENMVRTIGRRSLWIDFASYNASNSSTRDPMRETCMEHTRIMDALRRKDPRLVALEIRRHMSNAEQRVLAVLEEGEIKLNL